MAQTYIWQHAGLHDLHWQTDRLAAQLAEVNRLRGELQGRLSMFGFQAQAHSTLDSMTEEIVRSSEIEGERLSRDSVRSSVARQLGLAHEGLPKTDHYVEGVVQVMVDATRHYREPIVEERFFAWHAALFPMGYSGMYKITVGQWRQGTEAMQVVSGALGHQKIHYEAPPSTDVPRMMHELMAWVAADQGTDPLVKAAVAHLWFVTIHPFDDGNGRLCRTLTETLLSRADHTSQRYYSLSAAILAHRKAYYAQLEAAQKGGTDVTEWVAWFLEMLREALNTAIGKTEGTVRKVRFWDRHAADTLNDRQRKVLNLLLDGFRGSLNSSKWYKINHCSQDTAIRDLNDLVERNILRRSAEGGRSTTYELADEGEP